MTAVFGFYHAGGGSATGVLGGAISSAVLTGIFPDVDSGSASSGVTHYAGIYIKNISGSTITNAGVYLRSVVSLGRIYIANSITGNQTIANQTTAPADDLIWTQPLHSYSPLSIGSLTAGSSRLIWLKRVIPANTAGSNDQYLIIEGVQ
jgi:hypothetical protein